MTATDRRTVAFDPHVHTARSHDCGTPVAEVLRAARGAGLDAVAVTDHDAVEGALQAMAEARTDDPLVVPGAEVSTADGHLLALGVCERPPAGRPLAATVEWVRERGGVAVVPHPFQVTRHGVRKRDLVDCDALEARNALTMTGVQNARAAAYAARRDLPALGASDAHTAGMVGRAYTEVDLPAEGELTVEGLLAAVRAGRTRPAGETASALRFVSKYARALRARTAAAGPRCRSDHG